MKRRTPRWSEVLAFFQMKIDAADSCNDPTYAEWLRRLLTDLARYVQR